MTGIGLSQTPMDRVPKARRGEKVDFQIIEIGPDKFRVMWRLSTKESGETIWLDGGFLSHHKTRASAEDKVTYLNYWLTFRHTSEAVGRTLT